MRALHSILLTAVLCCSLFSVAQNKSNRGKEFWLGYSFSANFFPHPGLSDPVNAQEMSLYISTSSQPANVTVSINGTAWTQTLSIPANTADASILIPKTGVNDARILSDGLSARAIHVVSDVPVAVYSHAHDAMYSAATMLMPAETWGYIYYSVNYYQTQGLSNPPFTQNTQGVNFPDWYNWFYIVAKDDNTRVQITPSDTCKNGWLPGQTYTVNLNKGEIYTVFGKANFAAGWFTDTVNSSKDLTGSKILSVAGADGKCHPVAVFSGTGGMHVCQRDGGEAVQQQVFPAQAWGTRYLTHHTINNFSGDINATFRNYYRICVKDPTTVVKRNGVVLTGLIRNFFYQFVDSTGGDYIEADKPILVAQYTPNRAQCWQNITPAQTAIGDPEMFYLSPMEQGQNAVIFYTSSQNLISKSYLNIIIPVAGLGSLLVDGAIVPATKIKTHPNNPAYAVAIADLSGSMDMQHSITSDSAFTATVYGLGAYESYGYNIGCNINNLNFRYELKNTFSTTGTTDTVTCPRTPFRLYAKTGYRLTNIHWQFSQVAGLTPNADSIIANPVPVDSPVINGRKYYTYTVQQDLQFANAGTYKIPVSYTAPNIDACNNTETDSITVVVRPGPVADFNVNSPACLRDTILFSGASNANGFTLHQYLWNFPDATTQNTVNAKKKFAAAGVQNVRYRVYATNGCAGDTTKPVTINPNPVANFGINAGICVSDSVRFTDSSTLSAGNIVLWYWDFGDGSTALHNNNQPFYHIYPVPGNYVIMLVTTTASGCTDTMRRTIPVHPRPQASFNYDRNTICVSDSIRFTDNSSIISGNIVSWRWNFGDGNTATYNNPNPFYHPYNTAGNFTPFLITVSNHNCASDTFRRDVFVSPKPTANFTLTGSPCIDSAFRFVSGYNGTANPTWYWDFGDGNTTNITTGNTATHAYATARTNITVKHMVNLGGGCKSDTAIQVIPFVSINPTASFVMDTDTLCAGTPIQFTSAAAGITQWQWNFGNGTGNAVPPFAHVYATPGNYTVTLIGRNGAGCGSAPVTQNLNIVATPLVNAGLDQFINTGGSAVLNATATPAGNYTYTWSPSTGLSSATVLNPTASPVATTTYRLRVSDDVNHCAGEDEVMVGVFKGVYIPSAFTPNGDGLNDVWEIPGLALYPDALVRVYNRYGQKIFETTNYVNRSWNGNFNGKALPPGTYVYLVQLNDGKKTIFKGTVNLLR